MFKVRLYQDVTLESPKQVQWEWVGTFRRDLMLPFAPYPGLKVNFPGEEYAETIEEVIWVAAGGFFSTLTTPSAEPIETGNDPKQEVASACERYQRGGWKGPFVNWLDDHFVPDPVPDATIHFLGGGE